MLHPWGHTSHHPLLHTNPSGWAAEWLGPWPALPKCYGGPSTCIQPTLLWPQRKHHPQPCSKAGISHRDLRCSMLLVVHMILHPARHEENAPYWIKQQTKARHRRPCPRTIDLHLWRQPNPRGHGKGHQVESTGKEREEMKRTNHRIPTSPPWLRNTPQAKHKHMHCHHQARHHSSLAPPTPHSNQPAYLIHCGHPRRPSV